MLFSLFLVTFSQQAPILCVYLIFGGLTMAAPVGHLMIKFNSIKFNSLGLLINILVNTKILNFCTKHLFKINNAHIKLKHDK